MSDSLESPEPLIDRLLAGAPSGRVLDLACGDGRRARRLAEQGREVVAIDASEETLERARAEDGGAGVDYVLGDMGAVERLVRGHFGAALCLGDALAHLLTPESVSRMLSGLKRRLLPGAPLLLHVLNYDRIAVEGVCALPVDVVRAADGENVVVRLVEPRSEGIFLHTTSTLRYRPAEEPIVSVASTHARQLRGWTRSELEVLLDVTRFTPEDVYGDLAGAPYDPGESLELVVVAR